MEFQSINTGRNITNHLSELVKGDVVFKKDADWMKDLSIDQLDKAFKVLPSGHPMKDDIAKEIEKRLDGAEAVTHKAQDDQLQKANALKGGKGDKMSIRGIAAKHKIPIKKAYGQLRLGTKIEMEHTNDKAKAKEIAMDHLAESGDYYDRLIEMEADE